MTRNASGLRIALVAAVVATLGDFLMLHVANATQAQLGLPAPLASSLPVGGVLGVLAIPVYALGYRGISRSIGEVSARRARIVLVCGVAMSLLGAFIHGWTAFAIRETLVSDGSSARSFEAMLAAGGALSMMWATATALVLAASLAIAAPRLLQAAELPWGLAVLNPALVTVVLAAIGLPFELGRALWLPAAPNVAHIVFFGAWLAALRGEDKRTRGP